MRKLLLIGLLWALAGPALAQRTTQTVPMSPGTQISASSGNVGHANAVAVLAAAPFGHTTYITSVVCMATGANSAAVVNLTVSGIITGTETFPFVFPAGVTTPASPFSAKFDPPMPASGPASAITVTLPDGGVGNTNAVCNASGFQL